MLHEDNNQHSKQHTDNVSESVLLGGFSIQNSVLYRESNYPPVKPVALNYGPLKAVC